MAQPKLTPSKDGLEQLVTQHLRSYFAAHEDDTPPDGLHPRIVSCVERPLIRETLAATGGNQIQAAKILGLNRNTLRKKIAELGLNDALKPRRASRARMGNRYE